jgi:hypothetical protein
MLGFRGRKFIPETKIIRERTDYYQDNESWFVGYVDSVILYCFLSDHLPKFRPKSAT